MARVQSGTPPTQAVHDVIVGPSGPARTKVVNGLIFPGSWLIDVCGTHPDNVADWTARTLEAARDMLAQLNRFRPEHGGHGMCITIADASVVLQDRRIRNNLEDILRAAPTASIKFRFVVVSLDVATGFGGSKTIRDAVANGTVIKAVSRG